jgi:hypothetical protein
MNASLRALLTGILDYAGLFPPAKLPLDQSVRNYARYRSDPEAWMLGRFICPAARLAELSPFVEELFAAGPPLAVSALGRGGGTRTEFHAGLDADLHDVAAFRQRHGGRAAVEVLETRLPPDGLPPVVADRETRQLLDEAAGRADAAGLTLFVEVPPGPHWREGACETLSALGCLNARRTLSSHAAPPVGFKLRCGGVEASAFPAAAHIARALTAGVPLKATAGLHHPFRRRDAALGVTMYGFLNLFVAGVLAHVHNLRPGAIEPILLDDAADDFILDDDGLRWGDWHVTTDEVRAARRHAVLSFGSCSFDEPRDDLRALGWL